MKYLKKKYSGRSGKTKKGEPLDGVANLFDVALVFIVALLLSLLSTLQILDFFDPKSEITLIKNSKNTMKIITKKGKEIKVKKVTNRKISGNEGLKLGTAYRLKDGRVIYIPEE